METYRVEVVEIETGKVVSVIGRNLTKKKAEKRIETGISRFNPDKVFVRDIKEE